MKKNKYNYNIMGINLSSNKLFKDEYNLIVNGILIYDYNIIPYIR